MIDDESRILALVEEVLGSDLTPEEACRECPELIAAVRDRLERFRSVLRRRRVIDFDQEVGSLPRVDQAVAFLALLELRKSGEIQLQQAAPFAPIRIARADVEEGGLEWNVRSA